MGTFTTAEILWMIKELQCPLDLEAIGAFTRNDVTKVLRTFIMTECNNNIVAELPLEWRPLATRHVPKIKASGPPASAAASSDPATPAEPEPTVDEIVQEMVAAGSGGNDAGSGDKDNEGNDEGNDEGDDEAECESEPEDGMQINIKVPGEIKSLPLKVASYFTVGTVKFMVKQHEKMPIKEQILIYDRQDLEDGRMLFEYHIKNNQALFNKRK